MDDPNVGLYEKYSVKRTDGKSEPGQKHFFCKYYVLDLKHDKFARAALLAYADACKKEFPLLARDLYNIADEMLDDCCHFPE
jgi:hypothetical protein